MSRIGKLPVVVPAGVTVDIAEDNTITVKGPKGTLSQKVDSRISVKLEDGQINVTRPNDDKTMRSMHGLYRVLINNMVIGVTTGFTKELTIIGTGYRAQLTGKDLTMMMGYSHPVIVPAPEGITFVVPSPTVVQVQGIDKQQVGQIAANIRAIRPPEPYLGKGIRYTGENVMHKEGKAAK